MSYKDIEKVISRVEKRYRQELKDLEMSLNGENRATCEKSVAEAEIVFADANSRNGSKEINCEHLNEELKSLDRDQAQKIPDEFEKGSNGSLEHYPNKASGPAAADTMIDLARYDNA